MKYYRRVELGWLFYIDANGEYNFQEKYVLPFLKILAKNEILVVTKVNNRPSNPSFYSCSGDESIINRMERGEAIFKSDDSLLFFGKTKVKTESGDYQWVEEDYVIFAQCTDYLNRVLLVIVTHTDIWTPVDYEDSWQVESGKGNMDRLEKTLKDIECYFGVRSDDYDVPQSWGPIIQYQYRLYSTPSNIGFALKYEGLPPSDFDLDGYIRKSEEVWAKYKETSDRLNK